MTSTPQGTMTFPGFHRRLAAVTERLAPYWVTANCLAEATFLFISGLAYCAPAKNVLILCRLIGNCPLKGSACTFFLQLTYSIILVSGVQHIGENL